MILTLSLHDALPISQQHLQDRLGYHFQDQGQLQLALTHRSFGTPNNERLEFLGDSVLNLILGEALYQRFPTTREGQLRDRKSTRLNSSHVAISYAVFCLKKKKCTERDDRLSDK